MAFKASKEGVCSKCNGVISVGDEITWSRVDSNRYHLACSTEKAPVTVGTNGNGHDGAGAPTIESAIKNLIASTIVTQKLDEEKVSALIDSKLDSRLATMTKTIEIKNGDASTVKLDMAHKDIEMLLKLSSIRNTNGHRLNVYLHGPAGSGKSHAAHQVAQALNLPYGFVSLDPQAPASLVRGYMGATGQYVETEFFRRFTQGGVFCIDEVDNASSSLLTALNSMIENGSGAFPHGVFPRHPDFLLIATANTIGLGGDIRYPERRALDSAFRDRFTFLEWSYDDALTLQIVSSILGADKAPEFISWAKDMADNVQARYPSCVVSPRAYIRGAILESQGISRRNILCMEIERGRK